MRWAGLMPAPAIQMVKPPRLWSRPRASMSLLPPRFSFIGVLPNSDRQTSRVSSSRPRCLRSVMRAWIGRRWNWSARRPEKDLSEYKAAEFGIEI